MVFFFPIANVAIEIEGLSSTVGCANIGKSNKGILVIIRGDTHGDKRRCKIYRNDILVSFVNATRSLFDDRSEGNAILDLQREICWYDGDIQLISTIIVDDSPALSVQTSKMQQKLVPNKLHTYSKIFKIMQSFQRLVTTTDVPCKIHSLKRIITRNFQGLATDNRLIIDLLSSLHEFFSKLVTRTNILLSFHENEILDINFNKYPNLTKI